jgi:hypothetical protein
MFATASGPARRPRDSRRFPASGGQSWETGEIASKQLLTTAGETFYCAVRYQSDHSHGYPACVATVTRCSGSAYFWSDW